MKSNDFLASLDFIDLLLDAIVVADAQGHFIYVSGASEALFGYKQDELIGKTMWDLVLPEDREKTLKTAQGVVAGDPVTNFENRYMKKNGEIVYIMWSARWLKDKQLRIAVAHDITARKLAEKRQAALYAIAKLTHQSDNLHTLFAKIHQIIQQLIPVSHFFIAQYNDEYDSLSFPYYVRSDKELNFDHHSSHGEFEYIITRHIINSGKTILSTPAAPYLDEQKNGPCCLLGIPLKSKDYFTGALVVQTDSDSCVYSEKDQALLEFVSSEISSAIERNQLINRLRHQAEYDSLTGIPNRELFQDRLRTAIGRARREQGQIAIFYIDLLRFKQVNDQLGHHVGDQLLRAVAERLLDSVRETDTVARQGGDEFVILVEQLKDRDDLTRINETINHAFQAPFDLGSHHVQIGASVGTALYPEDGNTEQLLLKYADQDMYQVKKQQHRSHG